MIITEKDYFQHYYSNEQRSAVEKVMSSLFKDSDYTILFIGSGMSELEVLQFAIDSNGESRIFCLYGFLKSEQKLCNHLGQMFKEMNVTLIPFSMDEDGYDSLPRAL